MILYEKEAICNRIIRILLMTPSILKQIVFKKYNKFKFKICGIQSSDNYHTISVYNSIYLRRKKNAVIGIGRNFVFTSGDCFNPLSRNIKGCIYAGNNAIIEIGNNVGISSACIWVENNLKIGDNVKIGANSVILDNNCHSLNYIDRRNITTDVDNVKSAPITIDDDVMIGTNVIILKGVHIGARAVIGAGSVVTSDIPSDMVAAGNPCKPLRKNDTKI